MIWEVPVYGFSYERTAISSARAVAGGGSGGGSGRRAAYELRIKGYGFGETQGTGEVEIDGVASQSISSWSPTLVTVDLAGLPSPSSTVTLTTDEGDTSSINGILIEIETSVGNWQQY
jgi:hypothetical protein